MLVIRLQRTGRKNVPAFRLVVAEKARSAKGKVHEYIGHYLPTRDPHVFEFKKDRIEYWMSKGAQPSDTAARLLTREGVSGMEKNIKKYTKKKKRKEEEPKAEVPAAAPTAEAATEDAPKEEAPKEEVKEETKNEEPKKEDASSESSDSSESSESDSEEKKE